MEFEVVLCDDNFDLIEAWRESLRHASVSIVHGDFFDISADAYVSPANSQGIMDGGIDLLLRSRFPGVDVRVQLEIDRRGGIIPVGEALIVETGDWDVSYLISAPTMEIPGSIVGTSNVYLAMRAILRSVQAFNRVGSNAINSVAIPGLGTGVGRVSPYEASRQMAMAFFEFASNAGR